MDSLFREIVKILSADEFLINEIRNFVESLGISWTDVRPLKERYELSHCGAGALMEWILSEWISKEGDKATLADLLGILLQMEFKACAEELQELQKRHSDDPGPIKLPNQKENSGDNVGSSGVSGVETKPIVFGFRNVVLNFIGRDEELKKLNEYFHSEEPFVVISGLGGIGKTELTKKFAQTVTFPDTENSQIVKSWLSGESPQSLISSTAKFCHHLNLTVMDPAGKPLDMEKMLQNIITKLKSSAGFSKWLVVIDNVDETNEEFKTAVKTLQDFRPDVFLLVTSRRRDIYAGESEHLELTELKQEDSIEYVKKSLKIIDNSNEETIKLLCDLLGNFPLALSQAVAFIRQQQKQSLKGNAYGVQDYLDELSETETLGLDEDLQLSEYPKATLKVWHITLDKIRDCCGADGAMALDFLDVMAFINPDEIQVSFLCKVFKLFYTMEGKYVDQMNSCLKILLQYSLISSCNSVISVHRLVQLAVRVRMSTVIKQKYVFQRFFRRVKSLFRKSNLLRKDVKMLKRFWASFDSEKWDRTEMTNILKIWNHSSSHRELDTTRAAAIETAFYKLRDLGMVNESLEFASQGCEFFLSFYGPENKEYFLMQQCLAIALRGKGQYQSSVEKLRFVYGKFKQLCGEDYKDTLDAGHFIADVLIDLKEYEESLEWGRKILQSEIRIYGENNESTMRTKHNVAAALQQLGKREEALKIYNEILQRKEVHLGKHHPSTLATRHNIATCLYQMGNYKQALEIFQNVLSLQDMHLGVDHPETLKTKGWLADTLFEMGKTEEALKISEEVLVARENVLGPGHPKTVIARNNVALFQLKIIYSLIS